MPSSTIVSETEPPIAQDWQRVWGHVDPCCFPSTVMSPPTPLGDMVTAFHEVRPSGVVSGRPRLCCVAAFCHEDAAYSRAALLSVPGSFRDLM